MIRRLFGLFGLLGRHARLDRRADTLRRGPRRARFAALATGATLLAFARAGSAETSLDPNNGSGMNTRLFRGAVDSKGFFTVNGTDVIGKYDIAFGLVLDGGFGLLRLRDKTPEGVDRDPTRLLGYQFHGTLFANFSPFTNFVIGLGLPTD